MLLSQPLENEVYVAPTRLNPCCNGCCSRSCSVTAENDFCDKVSILVVMDVALAVLNEEITVLADPVSILVVMDVALAA